MAVSSTTLDLLHRVALAADDALGENQVALDVSSQLYLADCFLIISADNLRHSRSIVDAITRAVREQCGRLPDVVEGERGESGWLIIDYGDLVVHVLIEEEREYYALEKLWRDSPTLDLTLPDLAVDR